MTPLLRWIPLLFVSALTVAVAQESNGQGKILWAIGQWLSANPAAAPLAAMGWTDGGNPCNGWAGVMCNADGYVTSINVNGKGLTGSIPSDPGLWSGLTGLTNLDMANNQLSGPVPAAVRSAPVLNSVNLDGNTGLCGYLPTGLPANTQNTGIGLECRVAATPSPSPMPSPSPSPAPVLLPSPSPSPAVAPSADAANATSAAAGPPAAAPGAAAPASAPAPPTVISDAPICSCALQGFGSLDCAGALAKECRGPSPPTVCNSTASITSDAQVATALSTYLASTCFTGQDMNTSICSCVQNLLGNDCAKARVSLCLKGDPLCLPIQQVVGQDVTNSTGDAAQQVSTALDSQCVMAEPTQPGVKATMQFSDLSMSQYISKQYTQNVANALSSVTNVPTSSISTLDVRPYTGASQPAAPKRLLLQASINGVQATYFLATDDPTGVSKRLSTAAEDSTLSSRLAQYGISAQAGGLRVQSFLEPVPPQSAVKGSSFPMWALAPIIVGSLLLLGLIGLLLWCCCCRRTKRRGKKATDYAPTPSKPVSSKNLSSAYGSDVAGARDMTHGPPGHTAAPAGSYKSSSAAVHNVVASGYQNPNAGATYNTIGNGKASKGYASGTAMAVGAVAAGTAAAKYSNGGRMPHPESPASSKGGGSKAASLTGAGAAVGPAPHSGPSHLSTLQSLKVRAGDAHEPISRTGSGNSSLTPWESSSKPVSGSSLQQRGSPRTAASSGVTGASLRPAGVATGAAAGASAVAAGGAALGAGRPGPTPAQGGNEGSGPGTAAWKSNVRSASGQLQPAGSSTMMANPAAKSSQQAERAKFWAQFQETWQQVRQTQNVDNEPGSPSSGTNWTDITDARTFRH